MSAGTTKKPTAGRLMTRGRNGTADSQGSGGAAEDQPGPGTADDSER